VKGPNDNPDGSPGDSPAGQPAETANPTVETIDVDDSYEAYDEPSYSDSAEPSLDPGLEK